MIVRVETSIKNVEPKIWDELCDDPVFSHGWFLALEESGVVEVSPRHLILEENGEILGILPCFLQFGDPYYTLSDWLFGPLSPWFKRFGINVLPALLAFSPLARRTELFLAAHVERASAVRLLTKAMDQICKEEKIGISGWLFVSGGDRQLAALLRSQGHLESFLCPTAFLKNDYEAFDDYLESLRRHSRLRYKSVRNELNRHARSSVCIEEKELDSISAERLAAMHKTVYERYQPDSPSPLFNRFL